MTWLLIGKLVTLFVLLLYIPPSLGRFVRGDAVPIMNFVFIAAAGVGFAYLNGWVS